MKGFIRIFVMGALILAVMASTAWAQGTRFPIIAWGCPNDEAQGLHYRDYFSQIASAHFNTIFANFETQDYQAAQTLGLQLIQPIYYPYCEGQTSVYESDRHAIEGQENTEHFSHTSVVGQEVQDIPNALNGWAWLAQRATDPAGYMQRDLLSDFNKEQNVLREDDPLYDPHVFYADFRMRMPTIVDEDQPIVQLEVILSYDGGSQTLAVWPVMESDFVDLNAIGSSYADFRLRFELTWEQEQHAGSHLDYRVNWYDRAEVYLDRVAVQDTIYSVLINHGYDAEMNAWINTYNPYYPATLFRWYLADEPPTDMYRANNYVNMFLESHTPTTAQDVQATGGDVDRLEELISVINPNQLAYDSYPFRSVTDTSSNSYTPPFEETLQTALDGMLQNLATARQYADYADFHR